MGVDNETSVNYINIVIPKKEKILDIMELTADNDGQNETNEVKERGYKNISLTTELGSFGTDEYYFDESNNEIYFSGEIATPNGDIYVSFTIPLSDIVLIDILQHGIKRLNKLKTALETLK